ncbi:SOS response-associated peptidase family protein [Orrella sp. JC864]|uniref:SOS response-associated peptidase n=1 Tax=Orrella sp. JC864 TaxID=3120298 RepID=UPI00300A572B
MCSHYQGIRKREQIERYFRVRGQPVPPRLDMWPRYTGEFIRRPPEHDAGDEAVPEREIVLGRWGLVSALTRQANLAKAEKLSTFNARSETAATSYTFGNSWRKGQRCIIPAESIFEPDWRSGKAVPTAFRRADGAPLGIAGLWDRYRNTAGEWIDSYTMLTINADQDPLWSQYHRPGEEKRSVVILTDGAYDDWVNGAGDIRDYLRPYPSGRLIAEPVPR